MFHSGAENEGFSSAIENSHAFSRLMDDIVKGVSRSSSDFKDMSMLTSAGIRHILSFKKRICMACALAFFVLVIGAGTYLLSENKAIETTLDVAKNEFRIHDAKINKKVISIGFVSVGVESDWYLSSISSVNSIFPKSCGYDVMYADCDSDINRQRQAVLNFIDEAVDYIIIDPIEPDGWKETLVACQDAGIPVIIINHEISEDDMIAAWVTGCVSDEGTAAAYWYDSYRKKKAIDEVNALLIGDDEQVLQRSARLDTFSKVAEKKNWNILSNIKCDGTTEGAYSAMNSAIMTYGDDINLVVCQHDVEMIGVIQSLEETGVPFGNNKRVTLISFDGSQAMLQNLYEEKINAEFVCYPLHGTWCYKIINKIERGQKYEKEVYMKPVCYGADDTVSFITYRSESGKLFPTKVLNIKRVMGKYEIRNEE